MKVHVTNLYNFNSVDELKEKQHQVAEAGRSLGFSEMGIFNYPVETDTQAELSKRLDGIIASLETEDLVFIQLPTRNRFVYEQKLFYKIKAYRDTKIILILHDLNGLLQTADRERYLNLLKESDGVVVFSEQEVQLLNAEGIRRVIVKPVMDDFYIKKAFMDAQELLRPYEESVILPGEEIHIGFGLHDKNGDYSVNVGVVMQSIIENTTSYICFHILHDDTLNDKNRQRLLQVAKDGGQRVEFHFLDKAMFDEFAEQAQAFTIGTMFRIMIPELMPELSRLIYLDADILVHRDVKELWDMDISEYYLAAALDVDVAEGRALTVPVMKKEVRPEKYFNAGVLYLNLDQIRKKGKMCTDVINYLRQTPEAKLPDQDALNVVYGSAVLIIDNGWNSFVSYARKNEKDKLKNKIFHFAGTSSILFSCAAVDRLYFDTTSRTPWGEEACRSQMERTFGRLSDREEQLNKLITCCIKEHKKVIFYGSETFSMKNIYRLLQADNTNYRIVTKDEEIGKGIVPGVRFETLLDEKEPYVVLVLPEADNGTAMQKLEQLGLENGKGFFVIPRLLPPEKGGYL